MFKGHDSAVKTGERIAEWLADDNVHLSHSRAIVRDDLVQEGVKRGSLEEDQDLQDAVLSVHHSYIHTFGSSGGGQDHREPRWEGVGAEPADDADADRAAAAVGVCGRRSNAKCSPRDP